MSDRTWFWVWVQHGPAHYEPAASAQEAARQYAKMHKVPFDKSIYVSREAERFAFTLGPKSD